jgi:hypothetical protein
MAEPSFWEKVEALEKRGWKRDDRTFGPFKNEQGDPLKLPFFQEPDSEPEEKHWCNTELAYKRMVYLDQEGALKAAMDCYDAEILCNKCGKTTKKFDSHRDFKDHCVGYYGLINADVSGGYWSCDEIGDLNTYRFSLCEDCLVELFKTFTIPPAKDRYI